MKTLVMIGVVKKQIEELERIKESLIKSNDVGIVAKQYFIPILEEDMSSKISKLKNLEKILFFYDQEEVINIG